MATATATPESSWRTSPAATPATQEAHAENVHAAKNVHDLELRLLRAFGAFVDDSLVGSYLCVKRSSRLTTMMMNTTEALVTKTGLASLVGLLFAQFQRVAHPWLQIVDEAMGRRVIDMFVSILLLANVHEDDGEERESADVAGDLEAGKKQARRAHSAVRLSYHERIQALLQGELPRIEMLMQEAKRREIEAVALQQQLQVQQAKRAVAPAPPPPVVMDLSDFVPVDEVKRINDANKEKLQAKNHEVTALREQLSTLEREKQQLEQDLTDVHSYQESERGRRFQEMEVRNAYY